MAKKKRGSHGQKTPPRRAPVHRLPSSRLPKSTARQNAKRKKQAQRQVTYQLSHTERAELRIALTLVRKHIKGYSTQDGWKVSSFKHISPGRRATVIRKAKALRLLLNSPYDLVRVPQKAGKPDRKARHELYKFTHQKLRRAKHFIVHKPDSHFSVRMYHGRVALRGTFSGSVQGKRKRQVVTDSSFFLFDRTAMDEESAVAMLEEMLDDMPEGFYVVLTGAHGDTGEPVEKDQLVNRLRDYVQRYQADTVAVYNRQGDFITRRETDTGFVQAITGFRHLSTSVAGMELQMQARDARRRAGEEANRKKRRAQRTLYERKKEEKAELFAAAAAKRSAAARQAARTRRRKVRAKK